MTEISLKGHMESVLVVAVTPDGWRTGQVTAIGALDQILFSPPLCQVPLETLASALFQRHVSTGVEPAAARQEQIRRQIIYPV